MTANEAETLAGGASGERTARNPGMALAGAEADTAYGEKPKSERERLMSRVVERANMQRAYSRVMKNRGAPGVDGMRCEDLKAWLQANWAQIRKTLLEGAKRISSATSRAPERRIISRSITVTAPGVSSRRCGNRDTDSTMGISARKSLSDTLTEESARAMPQHTVIAAPRTIILRIENLCM